ncbi:MAG: histone deacetylase [Myxococcota bacterium]
MSDSRPVLVRDPRFREHAPQGSHPECPERLDAIDRALAPLEGELRELEPRPATDEEILRAHSRSHLDELRALEGRDARIDPDTYSSPRSLEVARLAAGSLTEATLAVARGETPSAFAAVRPPGHHAERARAMGFCLLNHVAIAVHALRREAGLERIAIVDWDVHHGNGTQHLFAEDPATLYVSTHQYPFYPGTGALCETGQGKGTGATVNLPLPAGAGDAEYGQLFDELIVPVLLEFRPELILVSAGFDAHARDPLASMNLTTGAFGLFAGRLRAVAEDSCRGRLVLTLEGGYDLDALGSCVAEVARVLVRPQVERTRFPPPSPAGRALVRELVQAHARTWTGLAGSAGA